MATPGKQQLSNLPSALSSFVGRERELVEVRQLLRTTRLLRLTGPGGCGKTRLALAAAGEFLPQFDDGVWLVEFGPLQDASLVPQAVASVLGTREQAGRSLTESQSNRKIAQALVLSMKTVETYVTRILGKLGFDSRVQIATWAVEKGLAPLGKA